MLTSGVPENAIPGSLEGTLKIYPNLNAHVLESIEGILERPYGCAEQTISSAYPSLLFLQYAKGMHGASPGIAGPGEALRGTSATAACFPTKPPTGELLTGGRGESDVALTAYSLGNF